MRIAIRMESIAAKIRHSAGRIRDHDDPGADARQRGCVQVNADAYRS